MNTKAFSVLCGLFRHFCVVTMLALGGCTTLPDIGPFVEATSELRNAVISAGSAVQTELSAMEKGNCYAEQFTQEWKPRVKAMTSLIDYADSLSGIVKSSEESGANFSALAENLKMLATTAGIVLPGCGIVDVVTDTGRFIYEQSHRAQAANSLEEALTVTQPAIEGIVAVIQKDLHDAMEILVIANTAADQQLRSGEVNQIRLGFRTNLVSRRDNIYSSIGTVGKSLAPAKIEELKELNALIASTEEWYRPLQTKRAQIAARRKAGQQLFDAATRGIREWAMAHKNLVTAVSEHRSVNVRSLSEAAVEIRTLVKRIREL